MTHYVEIPHWFRGRFFVKVHSLMGEPLTGPVSRLRAYKQLLAPEYRVGKILLAEGSNTVHVPGNEDRRNASEGEKGTALPQMNLEHEGPIFLRYGLGW